MHLRVLLKLRSETFFNESEAWGKKRKFLQQGQQRQQDQLGQAHHEHLVGLHHREHLEDQFHPVQEESGDL